MITMATMDNTGHAPYTARMLETFHRRPLPPIRSGSRVDLVYLP